MTSPRFLERYLAGEYMGVWRELIDLGDRVMEEPHRSDAIQVCEEVVRRARFNLRTLHTRLLDLGYEFAAPHTALVDAGPEAEAEIDQADRELGTFPLIARVWYRTLSSVNFCQAKAQLLYMGVGRPPTAPEIYGLGSHPVLIFQSLDRGQEQLRHEAVEHEEYIQQRKELEPNCLDDYPDGGKFLPYFPLGGWASNCEPKGFPLPCRAVDGVIYNDGAGDRYFVDELRLAFKWGGFPFWQWGLTNPKFYSPMEYRPNFEKLLPVLVHGLVEL